MPIGPNGEKRPADPVAKRREKHVAMLHLFFCHYTFCRIHTTLRVTPAMDGTGPHGSGLRVDRRLIDAYLPAPKRPGPAKGTKYRTRTGRTT